MREAWVFRVFRSWEVGWGSEAARSRVFGHGEGLSPEPHFASGRSRGVEREHRSLVPDLPASFNQRYGEGLSLEPHVGWRGAEPRTPFRKGARRRGPTGAPLASPGPLLLLILEAHLGMARG